MLAAVRGEEDGSKNVFVVLLEMYFFCPSSALYVKFLLEKKLLYSTLLTFYDDKDNITSLLFWQNK